MLCFNSETLAMGTKGPLNLREHKRGIAIAWMILFTSSCVIPIVVYFILKNVAKLPLSVGKLALFLRPTRDTIVNNPSTALGVPAGIFGATALLSYFQRLWSLVRKDSTTRPIGGSRWGLDYFMFNFTLGFCYITALISYSTASKPT